VDLEKAFDGVLREMITWAMRKLGDEEWLVSAVMSMYTGAKTVVRTVYGNCNCFEVKVGMHQGFSINTHTHTTVLLLFWNLSGTTRVSRHQKGKTIKVKPIWIYWSKRFALSPLLFAIVMEALCRELRVALPWELLYENDLVVIAETEDDLIKRLNGHILWTIEARE